MASTPLRNIGAPFHTRQDLLAGANLGDRAGGTKRAKPSSMKQLHWSFNAAVMAAYTFMLAPSCGGSSDESFGTGLGGVGNSAGHGGSGGETGGAGGQASEGGSHASECEALVSTNPRDLLDLDELKALSLADLDWTETSRKVNADGVTVLVGSWTSGQFCTFDNHGTPTAIDLQQKAELYLPPGFPNPALAGHGYGVVVAKHVATSIKGNKAAYSQIAKELGIPLLAHGEEKGDWASLGFSGRDELIGESFANAMALNACTETDFVTGNFALALARTNVAAITLLTRLAEAAGGEVTGVALRGGSKEGYATWLASAVDDRIVAAGPGGFHLEDVSGFDEYEYQSGCTGSGAGAADVVTLLTLREWFRDSPAGRTYADTLMVSGFKDLLYPEFLLICGDTAMPGMHDGVFFRLGAESPFLEGFTERDWRYDRKPNQTREGTDVLQARRLALLTARMLSGSQGSTWPQVTQATANDDGDTISVSAQATDAQVVRLWWNHSDDVQWNDDDQAEWQSVEMVSTSGTWNAPPITPPAGEQIAWYVEAERELPIASVILAARDSSPVRFERSLEPLSCDEVPPIECP